MGDQQLQHLGLFTRTQCVSDGVEVGEGGCDVCGINPLPLNVRRAVLHTPQFPFRRRDTLVQVGDPTRGGTVRIGQHGEPTDLGVITSQLAFQLFPLRREFGQVVVRGRIYAVVRLGATGFASAARPKACTLLMDRSSNIQLVCTWRCHPSGVFLRSCPRYPLVLFTSVLRKVIP